MPKKINLFLFLLLVIVVPIAYIPDIFLNKTYYNIFSTIASLCLGIAFVFSFIENTLVKRRRNPIILRCLVVLILIISIEFLMFSALNLNYSLQDLVSIIAVTMAIYVGYMNNFNTEWLRVVMIVYCIMTIILGYLSINIYIGTFTIEDQYMIEGKNLIGQLMSLCSIISFLFMFTEHNKVMRLSFLCVLITSILFLVIIRCRTALISSLLVIIFLSYRWINGKWRHIIMLIGLSIIMLVFVFLRDTVFSNILDAIGITDNSTIDDISSGRYERNIMAINYILDNPIYGELKHYSNIPWIHNWILLRLVRLGVFSLPLMVVYFYILIYVIRQMLNIKKWNIGSIGYILVGIAYISSLLEPEAPFAPGTIYIIHYILLGVSIRMNRSIT